MFTLSVIYEDMARAAEIFILGTTMVILMTVLPKINFLALEVSSVIDMIISGVQKAEFNVKKLTISNKLARFNLALLARYLFVLLMMFFGFYFLLTNLMRRMLQQNRAIAVTNNDYAADLTMSIDARYLERDLFSSLLQHCLTSFSLLRLKTSTER